MDVWWQITNMVRTDETRAKVGKIIREQWADPATREVSEEIEVPDIFLPKLQIYSGKEGGSVTGATLARGSHQKTTEFPA